MQQDVKNLKIKNENFKTKPSIYIFVILVYSYIAHKTCFEHFCFIYSVFVALTKYMFNMQRFFHLLSQMFEQLTGCFIRTKKNNLCHYFFVVAQITLYINWNGCFGIFTSSYCYFINYYILVSNKIYLFFTTSCSNSLTYISHKFLFSLWTMRLRYIRNCYKIWQLYADFMSKSVLVSIYIHTR